MFCLEPESDDPFFNLAIEETLLMNSDQEFMILGVNSPSVIIGKNQSAHKEVNTRFLIENRIPVIRRISGGGTVFHDKGNLNFTFIRKCEEGKQIDFLKYTLPVIQFLSSIGVEAKFEGKNDLKVEGLKISGNAEYVHRNRVLHHGTLLFSSSLEILRKCIRKDKSGYSTKAVESNPSPVMNLNNKLDAFSDIYEFRSGMMNYFLSNLPGAVPYNLTHAETENAESLAAAKYRTWEWNYAYGPEYTFKNGFDILGEFYTCSLHVKDGIILECAIEGAGHILPVAKKLVGCRHMFPDILKVFEKENIPVSKEEVFNFF
ncbi:MAG: lipoate--protein ligase [Bacteroidales bacterium]|nr:lipoate--protein ligase [Bacteroidales bacterium]